MLKGYLALVLHAHLPFIRHPEHDDFLEEDWLFEAITETYIPLIKVLEGQMKAAAKNLEFEKAALLRDRIVELRKTQELLDPLVKAR